MPYFPGVLVGPRKYRLVKHSLDNLLLQAEKGILTFTIEHRHIDVEYTHETVRDVLDSSAFPA